MPAMAADPRSPVGAPGIAPDPAEAPASPTIARAVRTNGAPGATATETLPQLGAICPYLRMPDGSHRTLNASREHRCWAVEPPAVVSPDTQADLCLVAAHARCDRYAAAQDRRAAGLATDHIPSRLVTSPRFAIPVDPVPVVVDARGTGREPGARTPAPGDLTRRRLPLIAAGIGVVLVGVIGLAALSGGLGGQPGATPPVAAVAGTSLPTSGPTVAPAVTPAPTPVVTPAATPSTPRASDGASVVPQDEPTTTRAPLPSIEIARTYLVKEGDTYRKLAKRFGLKPRDLRELNGRLKVGERILIPAAPWVTDAPAE